MTARAAPLVKTLTQDRLDALVQAARQSPRRRLNLNIHEALDDPINRLFNALETDTYIRPHRHPDKTETLIAVSGSFDLLVFDDDGRLAARHRLGGGGDGNLLLEYGAGTWHTLIANEPGSVFFELKAGPYQALGAADILAGWPAEQSEGVDAALQWLRSAQPGGRFTTGA